MTANGDLTTVAATYLDDLVALLHTVIAQERAAIAQAGAVMAKAMSTDGLVYVFGSGHSHMLAEEVFYRAGGSARMSPILKPPYMLHVSAQRSTQLEREHGHAADVLDGYPVVPGRDVAVVVSNSGANPLPVEVATELSRRGVFVIAITSLQYAHASTAPGPRLHQVADLVLDNHCPPGDALVPLGAGLPRIGGSSTVIGMTLLDTAVVEAMALQVEAGQEPDVYVSAGMPGGVEHNEAISRKFRERIVHI